MKSLIASIAIVGLVGLAVGVGTQAADTANVSATVTAELISVSVSDGSVAYGILPVNASEDTTASGVNNTQVVTNDSNVVADLDVKSSDAVGGTDWDLVAATGNIDEFTHEFSPDGTNFTTFNVVNATYTSLATNVAAGATQNLDLRIGTTTSVSDQNVQKTITVTVLVSTP